MCVPNLKDNNLKHFSSKTFALLQFKSLLQLELQFITVKYSSVAFSLAAVHFVPVVTFICPHL